MPRNLQDIRNIAFCGNGLAGKTMLVDRLLTTTGAVSRPASVDDGTSICDFDEEERHHKHTIESTLAHFEHGGKKFNVIDTPGYPDFIGQTLGALRGVDNVAIVIDAHTGIGVNTRRVFQEAGKLGLGRIIIITKMDSENVDYPHLILDIQKFFGHECLPLNLPIGHGPQFKGVVDMLADPGKVTGTLIDAQQSHKALIEDVIELDDEVTGRYFDGQEPTEAELAKLLVDAVACGHLIPVLCVSGKTGVGVPELLDALVRCTVPPDRVKKQATNGTGTPQDIFADAKGPLVAQVFKTRIDPFVHKLSFVRIWSGSIKKDDNVHVDGAKKLVKLHQLLDVQANETHPVDEVGAGDIVAVAKAEELHTGLSLGDLHLPEISFPTPMVGVAVAPKSRGDEAKLSSALHKIMEEDGTVAIVRDPQTKELVLNGMSELHLSMLRERLKRRDKVEVETHDPKIPYRETIQQEAEGSYRHKKQSGGRGQFGEVHIRMYPFPAGTDPAEFCSKARFPQMREYHHDAEHNFLWVDSIVGGSIPNNFLPAIEKGFKERLARGVIAGYQIQDVCVEVHFGKHHPVDSSEAAFKTAGSMAFREVFQKAKPSLLEPIVKLSVTVPGTKLGDISSDISGRRGHMLGMENAGGDLQTVNAEVPLAEVTTYARALSSITAGQGSYSIEFSHYDVVPGNVMKEIVDKAVLKEEEEE